MAGRPRKFDIDTAYNAALQLFWAQGYEATSLDQLVSTMGLSKSSFYQTFESKNSLFQNCLLHYGDLLVTDATKGLMETSSPIEFIHNALIQNAKEARNPDEKKGCFIMNTIVEFAQRDPKISKIVTAHLTAMKKVFTQAISSAQAHGDISKEVLQISRFCRFLFRTPCGAIWRCLALPSGGFLKTSASFRPLRRERREPSGVSFSDSLLSRRFCKCAKTHRSYSISKSQ